MKVRIDTMGNSNLGDINEALIKYYEIQIAYRLKSIKPKEALLVLRETWQILFPEYKKLGHSNSAMTKIGSMIGKAVIQC
jgi:hypothetical protein